MSNRTPNPTVVSAGASLALGAILATLASCGGTTSPPKIDAPPPAVASPAVGGSDAAGSPLNCPTAGTTASGSVGYADTVRTFLQTNCVSCHGASMTPPDLSTYESAAAAATASLKDVQNQSMPPTGLLSAGDTSAFTTWVQTGTPQIGNSSGSGLSSATALATGTTCAAPVAAPAPTIAPIPAPAPAPSGIPEPNNNVASGTGSGTGISSIISAISSIITAFSGGTTAAAN